MGDSPGSAAPAAASTEAQATLRARAAAALAGSGSSSGAPAASWNYLTPSLIQGRTKKTIMDPHSTPHPPPSPRTPKKMFSLSQSLSLIWTLLGALNVMLSLVGPQGSTMEHDRRSSLLPGKSRVSVPPSIPRGCCCCCCSSCWCWCWCWCCRL